MTQQSSISAAELEADAQEADKPVDTLTLAELQKLGVELTQLEREAAALEGQLASKSKQINYLKNSKLPAALLALKLKDFTLQDGSTIKLAEIVKGQITEENRMPAHDWLRQHGHGDLIKNEVKVTFGMGEDDYAKFLMHTIKEMCQDNELKCGAVEQKEAVHSSTLVAFLKEELKKGTALPAQTFGLDVFHVVKFTPAKEKKV